jgi:hexosaminidase
MSTSNRFKIKFSIVLKILVLIICRPLLVQAQDNDPNLSIIPAPAFIKKSSGTFAFSKLTVIKADRLADKSVVFLKNFLIENRHLTNKVSVYNPKTPVNAAGTILILTSSGAEDLPAEGYTLSITPHKIVITGKGAGLFYGIQTLIQLFPIENTLVAKLPCVEIHDKPRFAYRGMMLDVARHFFTVSQVKQVIDLLAAYKINNFHWHLVDSQGWRIEIKKYPKLTEIGGTRLMPAINGNREYLDQVPYTGFYTQEEIRDVVRYAAARYINIIPEIEMPAHSDAALRAYPELRCEPSATTTITDRGNANRNSIYCPTEETFTFLEGVLTEVIALFPGKFIHIGGDEANKQPWIESQYSQDLMKQQNLKDEHELQSYFIQRMEKFINSKGRSIIGWDEILEGGLAQNATVMSWRGEQGGIAAAKQKHNVIMTPQTNGLYFDHYLSRSPFEPVSFGSYAALNETYSYNPIPKALSREEQKYILGTQGNLWTEYVQTFAKLQFQILPRLFALSEVAWSKVENKDYKDFSEVRLAKHLARLDVMNYNYRVPPALEAIDTMVIGPQFTYTPKSVVPGAKIYYTLNGRNPLDTDWEYSTPLTFTIPPNERRELKTMVISPSGRRSIPSRVLMYNRQSLPATDYTANNQGLKSRLIKGKFISPLQLDDTALNGTAGTAITLATDQFKAENSNFGVVYEGFFSVPADGTYNISLSTYTDAVMWIDDQKLVEFEEPTPLLKGFHKIKINYIYNAPPAPIAGGAGFSGAGRRRPNVFRIYLSEPGAIGPKKDLNPAMLYN